MAPDKRKIPLIFLLALLIMSFILIQHVSAQDLSDLKNTKPFAITGNVGVNTSFYSVSGIPDRQAPFAYGVNASATMTLFGIAMPFSFSWYNNNKAGFHQPFNQFGISPTYKWLTLHLGYRNLSFSEFTLSGYTFLGAGVEAKPGKFRLGRLVGFPSDNPLVVVLDEVHGKLPQIFDDLPADAVADEGLLQQHIPAVLIAL